MKQQDGYVAILLHAFKFLRIFFEYELTRDVKIYLPKYLRGFVLE